MSNRSVLTVMNASTVESKAVGTDQKIDGYSIPVYGIAQGTFYNIHVPAMICICISFICAVSVIVYSFYHQHYSTYFSWTKSERFVVYMALCDLLFNVCHFADHFHVVYTKTVPRPKALCAYYGFMNAEFVTAQNLMVNIVAINVFVLIYFRKEINFGKCDYRLLVYIFGAPALGCIVVAALGLFGPNGSFCYFDGIKGKIPNVIFTSALLTLVFIANVVLYTLSWVKIYRETRVLKCTLGKSSRALRASHRAAKTMSLFVTAFFIQWWALEVFGIWQYVADVPHLLFNFLTTFSNLGGLFNGIVFIIIMRRKREKVDSSPKASNDRTTSGAHTASTTVHSTPL